METKVNRKSWLVFGIAAVFYLYELALRVSPSVMTHDLMTTFNATATVLGLLVSFYYYAYTILQLPCGLILDKMGPRRLLGCSALLCVVGSAMFAGFNEISVAQVGRFLVGAGSACAFISCLQIAAKLFPTRYFVILAGVTNMMGTLGGLFGGPPVACAVNTIGWRSTTFWLAGIGIVIAILAFVFVPKKLETQPMKTKATFGGLLRELPSLLKNSQIVLSGIVASFMYLPVDAFAELWAVPFFMSKYGIGNEQASMTSAVVFIGVAIGSVLLAVVARKIGSYMRTIRISSLFTAVLFLPLIFSDCSIYIAFVFVFLIGFLTGAQPIGFVVAKNNASAEVSGTTLALTNCIVMLIGSIFQPFLGALLDFFWNGTTDAAGLRFYDVTCYQKAILIIPVFLVISYFVSMFIRETINCERE